MNFLQKKRIQKIFNEQFFILDKHMEENNIELKISGSTLNVYTIKIKDNNILCDCIDSIINCNKNNIYCKHVCFVYIKIGKNIEDDYIFLNKKLSEQNLNKIILNLSNNENVNNYLSNRYNQLLINPDKNIFNDTNIRNKDEDCPICYNELIKETFLKCPICENGIHENCIKVWLKNKDTCIYCRSDIWKRFKEIKNVNLKTSKYLNIS